MNKIYLVTGAAGFLGGTVCRKLVQNGERVRAFVLKNDPAMSYVPREAEVVEGDLCDMESLEQFFRVPRDSEIIVLHIASIVRYMYCFVWTMYLLVISIDFVLD